MEPVRDGDYMIDPATGEIVDVVPGLMPDGLPLVLWAMNKLRDSELESRRVAADRAARDEQYDRMARREAAKHAAVMFRFGSLLQAWAADHKGKRQSWTAPDGSGELRFRKTPQRVAVVDERLAVEWCKANAPAAVKTTEKVLVSELPPLPESAAVAQAFQVIPAGETFSVAHGLDKAIE